jgi:bacteriorhodopsin
VDTVLTVFYIIGCTAITIACIFKFTNPGPKDTKEALQDALLMLLLVVLWPGVVIVYMLSIILQWISGD